MSDDKYAEIELSQRFVEYLECLLNRVRIKSGYGCVSVVIENGRIHHVEYMVSELVEPDDN